MLISKEGIAAGFSERLKNSLFAMGQSQSDLARSIGASATAISTYLKGRLPEAHLLLAIAQSLNVEVQWLLTGEGPMRRDEEEVPRAVEGSAIYNVGEGRQEEARRLLQLYFRIPEDARRDFIGSMRMVLGRETTKELDQEIAELLDVIEKAG